MIQGVGLWIPDEPGVDSTNLTDLRQQLATAMTTTPTPKVYLWAPRFSDISSFDSIQWVMNSSKTNWKELPFAGMQTEDSSTPYALYKFSDADKQASFGQTNEA